MIGDDQHLEVGLPALLPHLHEAPVHPVQYLHPNVVGKYLLHKVLGGKPCPHETATTRCKYDHPNSITKEDHDWAKARKSRQRQPSPALGSPRTSDGEGSNGNGQSQGGGRRRRSRNKNKNKNKDNTQQS